MPGTTRPHSLPRCALLALGIEERCEGKLSRTVLKTSPDGDISAEFDSGKLCPGDHSFARDPVRLPAEFFLSKFRVTGDTKVGKSRTHPDDVSKLWDELAGRDAFPCEDLVPMLTVRQACDLTL